MNHWWRAYNEAVDDPKLILLSDKAHRAWFNLMCIASANEGILPEIKFVAVKLRITPQQASSIIAELVQAELIDRRDDGRFEPHNWNGRQYKSDVSTERVKRFRNGKRNVSEAIQKRLQTTETETETERTEANASGADAPPDPSEPERQFFERGKEVLGKSAGGQLVKLRNACGGNIALARSKIELAATKHNAGEFIAGVIRAGPASAYPAKPLTAHQRERETTRSILDALDQFGSSGGKADPALLRHDPSGGSAGVRGRVRGDVIDLPAARVGEVR